MGTLNLPDTLRSMARRAPQTPVVKPAPSKGSLALWFGAGVAVASLLMFFLDGQRGSARRHMAYDKAMGTGRDVRDWSGRRGSYWRNKAMGDGRRRQERERGRGVGRIERVQRPAA